MSHAQHECRCGDVDAQGHSARSSPWPMVQMAEAVQMVLSAAQKVADEPQGQRHVFLPLAQTIGHVVAQDRHATEPLPAFPASTMDGYAVVSSDGVGTFPVLTSVTAGGAFNPDFVLPPGHAAYITTGAPVPQGADAVLPVEWTEQAGSEAKPQIRVTQTVNKGDNIRPVGCDIHVGQTVLRAGQLVGPAEVGLAASLGLAQLHVCDKPRVGVLSSGDEVVDVSGHTRSMTEEELTPALGQIYDSNRPMLLSLFGAAGAIPVDLGLVRDDAATLEKAVVAALGKVDILVLSGGVSMGARDFVKPLLAKLGQVHFGRLNMKPGKPTTFATVRQQNTTLDKLVFGLPGNPVSALVTAQLLVLPAIRVLRVGPQGITPRNHGYPTLSVKLLTPLMRDATRPEYHRVHMRYDDDSDTWTARSTGSQISSRLLSGANANGLVRVEAGQGEVAAGEQVRALLVGDWIVPDVGPTHKPPVPARRPSQVGATPSPSHASAGLGAVPPSASVSSAAASSASASASASTSAPAPVFELRVSVLTVSDRCARGESTDLSGPAIAKVLESASLKNTRVRVVSRQCVSDDIPAIQAAIKDWTDAPGDDPEFPHLVLTTGGTGFAPRDVTPEAVGQIIQRQASGIVHAMMAASLAATPMGALSRPVAGARGRTLILTLPGSPKAVPEILTPLLPLLPHAVKLLQSKDDPHTQPSPAPQQIKAH